MIKVVEHYSVRKSGLQEAILPRLAPNLDLSLVAFICEAIKHSSYHLIGVRDKLSISHFWHMLSHEIIGSLGIRIFIDLFSRNRAALSSRGSSWLFKEVVNDSSIGKSDLQETMIPWLAPHLDLPIIALIDKEIESTGHDLSCIFDKSRLPYLWHIFSHEVVSSLSISILFNLGARNWIAWCSRCLSLVIVGRVVNDSSIGKSDLQEIVLPWSAPHLNRFDLAGIVEAIENTTNNLSSVLDQLGSPYLRHQISHNLIDPLSFRILFDFVARDWLSLTTCSATHPFLFYLLLDQQTITIQIGDFLDQMSEGIDIEHSEGLSIDRPIHQYGYHLIL